MLDTLWPLLAFAPFFAYLLFHAIRRNMCRDCGARLPAFMSPLHKTRRMWRAGGFLCARCGCETDMAGQKVTADTPLPPFPARQWVLVAVLFLVGLGLGIATWSVSVQAVTVPPAVALPQQAPPAPLAD